MHKEGCTAEKIYFSLTKIDRYGPDQALSINSQGISYCPNSHDWKKDIDIDFKFCPMCGCEYENERT